MSQYDKFYSYLLDLHQSHTRLLPLLEGKLTAVQTFNIDRLDEIIKEEQAYVLASKSFDSNISKFRRELGLTGDKLSEIIPNLPEEERGRFYDLFKQLESSLRLANEMNEKCQGLLEERLHTIGKSLRQVDGTASAPYSKPGGEGGAGRSPNFLTKSV